MLDSITRLFKRTAPTKPEPSTQMLVSDAAWGSSRIYSGSMFPQYNPDDLVGRKGLGIYKKMLIDEQVKAVTQFRLNSVTGRKHFFTPPKTETLSKEEKARRVMIFEEVIRQLSGTFKNRLDAIMSAMSMGFSLTEIVHEHIDIDGSTYIGIKSLKTKNPTTFHPFFDEYDNLIKIEQHIDGSVQELDINNFVHHVNNPNAHLFFGQSEVREAYRAYYSKDITIRFHNMWLERMAGGFIWAQPSKGMMLTEGTKEYNSLRGALDSIRNNTRLILPAGVELNIEDPTDTQAFERAISMQDKAIAKALLVPNLLGLSEQGSVGSNAQASTQLEAFLWDLDAQANHLVETLNEQLFDKLGALNFGDGYYPQFNLRRLSFDQIKATALLWADLTSNSVVESTLEDENFIRNMLDVPTRQVAEPEDDEAEITKPDTALNGAQVTSMLQVAESVSTGALTKPSAIALLITAYPISKARAEEIINPIEVRENGEDENRFEEGSQDPRGGERRGGNGERGNATGQEGAQGQGQQASRPDEEGNRNRQGFAKAPDQHDDNHIANKRGRTTSNGNNKCGTSHADARSAVKFARHTSVRRVDFSRIVRRADLNEHNMVDLLGLAVNDAVSDIMDRVELIPEEVSPKALADVKVSPASLRAMQNVGKDMIQVGWDIGQDHAKMEIEKALGANRNLMSKMKFARLPEEAAKFFGLRAFTLAGNLGQAIEGIIKAEILAGIQYSRSRDEVSQAIYDQMVTKGLVAPAGVPEDKINTLLQTVVPQHRLENIVRNNTFTAINESRLEFFSDPGLGDFVEAYEYSAILDDATTAICQELGGGLTGAPFIRLKDDPIWDIYRPQNHHGCRGLIIALITGDEYTVSPDDPENVPQEGFGK